MSTVLTDTMSYTPAIQYPIQNVMINDLITNIVLPVYEHAEGILRMEMSSQMSIELFLLFGHLAAVCLV